MKDTEKNTNIYEVERCWVHKSISTLWFNDNDQDTENSIDATILFLEQSKKAVKESGYENVVVVPSQEEGDENNLSNSYIIVMGWRLETDNEYKNRLVNLLQTETTAKFSFDQRSNYFTKSTDLFGTPHQQRVGKIQNILEKYDKL